MDNVVNSPKALICGDWLNAALIGRELVERHWDVRCTDNEDEANLMLLQEDYDLVVIEWRPPQHDGFHTLHHIRTEMGVKDVPVLVVTEGIDPNVEYRLKNYGHVGLMHIPFIGPDFDCFQCWQHQEHEYLNARKAA
ncbi:MAG TPA: response regulator [Fimbriimonas sp.]